MRPSPTTIRSLACLLAACALAATTTPARADKASSALAKYAGPVDKAIDKALAYLAKHQAKDGSFYTPMGPSGRVAVTGVGVMAFLAKGHTPGSGPYGKVIDSGIDFVVGQQQPNGALAAKGYSHGSMYNHGIATLMLSEVSGMLDPPRQKRVDACLSKALKLILAAQKIRKASTHQGGWRYQPSSTDSDISCTGWSLMSLRSARNNGARIPVGAIEQGVKFIMNCRSPRGDGGFCYQPGSGPGLARTGTALLCLELCGKHKDPACVAASGYILKHLPRTFGYSHFYYGLYYCSQGMFQMGGESWEKWGQYLYEMMLKHQRPDGSWPQGSSTEARAGACYSTAMGVLAMSVSYRQLPIYQR